MDGKGSEEFNPRTNVERDGGPSNSIRSLFRTIFGLVAWELMANCLQESGRGENLVGAGGKDRSRNEGSTNLIDKEVNEAWHALHRAILNVFATKVNPEKREHLGETRKDYKITEERRDEKENVTNHHGRVSIQAKTETEEPHGHTQHVRKTKERNDDERFQQRTEKEAHAQLRHKDQLRNGKVPAVSREEGEEVFARPNQETDNLKIAPWLENTFKEDVKKTKENGGTQGTSKELAQNKVGEKRGEAGGQASERSWEWKTIRIQDVSGNMIKCEKSLGNLKHHKRKLDVDLGEAEVAVQKQSKIDG